MPTALIVEDDPDQAEMAARLLRYRNFDSDIAATGGEGLAMARSLKPDVVLLDLMLPDTTGFDVCRGLRGDRETMLTPVVMLTALGDDLNRTEGLPGRGQRLRLQALRRRGALPGDRRRPGLAGPDGAGPDPRRDPRPAQQRGLVPPGSQRLPDERQPGHPVHPRAGPAAPPGPPGDGPERDRVGQPPPVRASSSTSPTGSTPTGSRSSSATRGRASTGPSCPTPPRPRIRSPTWASARSSGLREGGFGLLITDGMVDEMRYNDAGQRGHPDQAIPARRGRRE